MTDKKVADEYLGYRKQVLDYTNEDMNLPLDNDEQIYIAVFDIPVESGIVGFHTFTLALVFGLNTHIYHGSGEVEVGLEKKRKIMKAMQSALMSLPQVLGNMELKEDTDFYDSDCVRVYLKTRKGTYFKEIELNSEDKFDQFTLGMMNHVLKEIKKRK